MMTKKMKTMACLFLCILLTASFSVCSFAKSVGTGMSGLFETWTGSGDSACVIHLADEELLEKMKYDDFEKLWYGSEEVPTDCYTVTEQDGYTVITLKEDYLENLSTGTYVFQAEFTDAYARLRIHVIRQKIIVKDFVCTISPENYAAAVYSNSTVSFYADLFESLSYRGETVDSENYLVEGFDNNTSIAFEPEFIASLAGGTYYFNVNFKHVDGVLLKLTIYAPYMPGDCDGDAAITAQDARLALRSAANLENLSGQAKNAACVLSENGAVTAADARKILRVAASLEEVPLAK